MSLWRSLRDRLGASARLRAEVDDEIRAHLELRVRDLMAAGMDRAAAEMEAESRFGELNDARRRLYASARRSEERLRLTEWIDSVVADCRVAMRRLRATPGFSTLSVATFALGIGLTTTMFSVMDAALLRPLPYPDGDRLVALWSVDDAGNEFRWISATNWLDWREQNRSLAATGLYSPERMSMAAGGEIARVAGAEVGGAFFETLRAPIVLGRAFSEQEADERAPVAVVSESFWRRHLGATDTLGDVLVNGVSRRVVGVLADRHALPERTDIWVPAVYRRLSGAARNNINWEAVARLAPGTDRHQARSDLDRIAAGIREEAPEAAYSWGVGVVPLHEVVVGDADDPLLLLVGAVAFVLLVACANLAGQSYARSLGNVESAAVRLALGATRWRVLQHQLVEHLIMGALGGLVGLGLSVVAIGWLAAGRLPLPRADTISIDLRVVSFAVVVSIVAGLLAGLLPAWRVARSAPRAAMGSVRGASGGARAGAATLLVGAEIALSVLLLIGGGMLVRGFVAFVERDLGYDSGRLFVAEVELAGPEYGGDDAVLQFWDRLLEGSRSLPGVLTTALAREVPGTDLSGYGRIELPDRPDLREAAATYRVISEGYFQTIGLPLLAGREFEAADAARERVVIVSRSFVDSYWPDGDALGRRFQAVSMEGWAGPPPPLTVIGVVEDLDNGTGIETRPSMYVLHRQTPFWGRTLRLVARTSGPEPLALAGPFRGLLREIDATLAAELGTVDGYLASLLARDRLVMSILNVFALLALGLAAIGVHGLLSFSVARRTREIAVRSALGADRSRILRMVLGTAVRIALIGTAVGALGGWWLSGLLQAQLTQVDASDPVLFAVVTATLIGVTVAAAALPAWRAVRLSPIEALRAD